jgi:hypothetical protein
MGIAREHPRADVACELPNRLFADGRILGKPRDESMPRIVKPVIDPGLGACGLVSALVAVGSHGAVKVDPPEVRPAPMACKADVMEGKQVGILSRFGEPREPQGQSGAHSPRKWNGAADPGPRLRAANDHLALRDRSVAPDQTQIATPERTSLGWPQSRI